MDGRHDREIIHAGVVIGVSGRRARKRRMSRRQKERNAPPGIIAGVQESDRTRRETQRGEREREKRRKGRSVIEIEGQDVVRKATEEGRDTDCLSSFEGGVLSSSITTPPICDPGAANVLLKLVAAVLFSLPGKEKAV